MVTLVRHVRRARFRVGVEITVALQASAPARKQANQLIVAISDKCRDSRVETLIVTISINYNSQDFVPL